MSRTWRILSLDGGGIRGLIPATVLQSIERRTGHPICELFDIIAGTSTGGILALGLTKPDQHGKPVFSAQDLKYSYLRNAAQIFANPASWWENLLRPKYRVTNGIEKVMHGHFGDVKLSQAITDIVIPCYDIEQRVPHIFKSRWARRQPQYDIFMRDVARAASATPTLFEPLRIARPELGGFISLVDGGVFANNPALLGYAEINAMRAKPGDDFLVVSLGTGESMEKLEKKYITDWGFVRWSIPMIELVSESNSEAVHEQMRYILAGSNSQNYYRFQADLPDEVYFPLDNPSQKNMDGLLKAADSLFEDPQTESEIATLCAKLLELHELYKNEKQSASSVYLERMRAATATATRAKGSRTVAMPTIVSNDFVSDAVRQKLDTAASPASAEVAMRPDADVAAIKDAGTLEEEPLAAEDSHYQYMPSLSPATNKFQISICYALEDYAEVVEPLTAALKQRGIIAHFEKFGLPPKGSIRRLISQAAETTLINAVILSPALFHNQWSAKQLQWLYKRTLSGKNVILPIVHGYSKLDVPRLAQQLNSHWKDGSGKYLEYLTDLAEGSTIDGVEVLADRIARDLKLWFS